MYELIQIGENTFYIDCPAKMGVYHLPNKHLRNKFLLAEPSCVRDIAEFTLPQGMEVFPLKDHYFDMNGS